MIDVFLYLNQKRGKQCQNVRQERFATRLK